MSVADWDAEFHLLPKFREQIIRRTESTVIELLSNLILSISRATQTINACICASVHRPYEYQSIEESPISLDQLSCPTMSGKTSRSSTIQADRIGSLLFCPACGTLLSLPGDLDEIACEQCGRREPASCELARVYNDVLAGHSETIPGSSPDLLQT